MFGLFAIVVTGMIGATIDYERASQAKARLSAAADSASLAAARKAADLSSADPTRSNEEIIAEAEAFGVQYFVSNTGSGMNADVRAPVVHVRQEGGVWVATSQFSAKLKTLLASVIGFDKMDIAGSVEATVAPGFPVLDIAMCVDSTGSMTDTLDAVKANALGFFDNLNAELATKGITPFPLVRVRMIYFKDFGDATPGVWDSDPIVQSNFFSLPDQNTDFNAFVAPQVAGGGADWAESGVECLNEAVSSAWIQKGDLPPGFTQRVTDVFPLVIVWTDASSHRIGYPNSLANPAYPAASHMPRTDAALLAKWNNGNVIDQKNKQILFFGDPAQPSLEADGGASGWHEIMTWPKFTHGGTVTEANASMMGFIATGIATNARGLSVTQ